MMSSSPTPQISVLETAWNWWRQAAAIEGKWRATRRLSGVLWEFACDSTPERLRARFGDADYDWDFRVNTTSGAVGWRDRLLGAFHSEYQPTEPALFHEMMGALEQHAHINFNEYILVDLGSGKGRTLLMASDHPFHRITGVELLPALHHIAEQNLAQYHKDSQKCFALESVCADATEFALPLEPLVLYLFNPFGDSGLRKVVANLAQSLKTAPRPVYVLYHNPLLEYALAESAALRKIAGTHQYSIFASV